MNSITLSISFIVLLERSNARFRQNTLLKICAMGRNTMGDERREQDQNRSGEEEDQYRRTKDTHEVHFHS